MDSPFSNYHAIGVSLLGLACVLTVGTSVAVLAGKHHLQRPAWSAIALVLLASLQLLGWGVVHGAHGLYLPAEARLEAVMDGLAPGLNAFALGIMSSTAAAFLMVVSAFRLALIKA